MTAEFSVSMAEGKTLAPPSKSEGHRALICAALTDKSRINNLGLNEDIKATLDCLKTMGATVETDGDGISVGGLDIKNIKGGTRLFVNESGSTLRFLIPLCLYGETVTFYGAKRLFERPLSVYEDIFRDNNISFTKGGDFLTVCGKYPYRFVKIKGDVSSQFISGFCFYFAATGGGEIEIIKPFESCPYAEMTIDVLNSFGISATLCENKIKIGGGFKNTEYTVSGDYSSAAFSDAFNLLGGNVEVLGLNEKSKQGDKIYKAYYADILKGKRHFDLTDCPDLAPVLFSLAAHIGEFRFTGTGRLKLKESDRGECMKAELSKFGADMEISDNEIIVKGGNLSAPKEILSGHNDHRIVMALSVLCSFYGGKIEGVEAVKKSFPDFFLKIKQLGVEFSLYET